jgi:hypothetical protein
MPGNTVDGPKTKFPVQQFASDNGDDLDKFVMNDIKDSSVTLPILVNPLNPKSLPSERYLLFS